MLTSSSQAHHPEEAGITAMTCQTGDTCEMLYTACTGGYLRAWRLGDLGTVNYANKVSIEGELPSAKQSSPH